MIPMVDLDLYGKEVRSARSFHFRNMHVYINEIFEYHAASGNKYSGYYDSRIVKENHHVHIFQWSNNLSLKNLQNMAIFIHHCNMATSKPVYIHLPKEMDKRNLEWIKEFLEGVRVDKDFINYRIIVEKNSNVTDFVYGEYIPDQQGGIGSYYNPKTHLLINWDYHGMVGATYYSEGTKNSRTAYK